jgi:hypothetical protein
MGEYIDIVEVFSFSWMKEMNDTEWNEERIIMPLVGGGLMLFLLGLVISHF